jgi:mannitol-1-/sugar-/sorbitol-6-/2-deoxyglucose-6-phosphatase
MSAAVIFDMDGLLLDSEDFWQQAEFEMFSSLGVPLKPDDTAITLGWRCDYVVQYWYSQFPWQGATPAEVGDAIIDKVIQLIVKNGKLMPGAVAALTLSKQLSLPTALATSSNHRMMLATLKHFDLLHYFQATCSAEFLPYAKPHPQVYLNAAAALGVEPQQCVALEDSITGVIAAKAARMRCIAVPEHANFNDARYAIADLTLPSLLDLTAAELIR